MSTMKKMSTHMSNQKAKLHWYHKPRVRDDLRMQCDRKHLR